MDSLKWRGERGELAAVSAILMLRARTGIGPRARTRALILIIINLLSHTTREYLSICLLIELRASTTTIITIPLLTPNPSLAESWTWWQICYPCSDDSERRL